MGQGKGLCPGCGKVRRLTPKGHVFYQHEVHPGVRCPGSGGRAQAPPLSMTKTPPVGPAAPVSGTGYKRHRPPLSDQEREARRAAAEAKRPSEAGRAMRETLEANRRQRDAHEQAQRVERAAQSKAASREFWQAVGAVVAVVAVLVVFIGVPLVNHFRHRGDFDAGVSWVCEQFRVAVRDNLGSVTTVPPNDVLEDYDDDEFQDAVQERCGADHDAWYAQGEDTIDTSCDARRIAVLSQESWSDELKAEVLDSINSDPVCVG